MAGDWIKMRVSLRGDPAVKGIARRTGLSRFEVVGRLHAVWSWADQNLGTGNAQGVTAADLDDEAEHPGFAQAMSEEGWLKILSTGLSFPNFDRHNGKPAKERALTAQRVKRHRNDASVTKPLPEKRREEPISNSSDNLKQPTPGIDFNGGRNSATAQPMTGSTTPPNAKRRIDRTRSLIDQQREDAAAATPMPEHLRKPTNGATPHEPDPLPDPEAAGLIERAPDPPPDDDDATLDHQAAYLGMSRTPLETDEALAIRIQARRNLG